MQMNFIILRTSSTNQISLMKNYFLLYNYHKFINHRIYVFNAQKWKKNSFKRLLDRIQYYQSSIVTRHRSTSPTSCLTLPLTPSHHRAIRRCRKTVLLSLATRAQLKRAFYCHVTSSIVSNRADGTGNDIQILFFQFNSIQRTILIL